MRASDSIVVAYLIAPADYTETRVREASTQIGRGKIRDASRDARKQHYHRAVRLDSGKYGSHEYVYIKSCIIGVVASRLESSSFTS
jgi:hypothetical protein